MNLEVGEIQRSLKEDEMMMVLLKIRNLNEDHIYCEKNFPGKNFILRKDTSFYNAKTNVPFCSHEDLMEKFHLQG